MEALMQLQIITPDHLMCDESVKMVEMRTAEGEIGVLPIIPFRGCLFLFYTETLS